MLRLTCQSHGHLSDKVTALIAGIVIRRRGVGCRRASRDDRVESRGDPVGLQRWEKGRSQRGRSHKGK